MKQSETLDMITKLRLAQQAMESACKRIDELKEENKNLKEALAKQEQGEPVAWLHEDGDVITDPLQAYQASGEMKPLYTTPYVPTGRQQRTAAEGEDTRRAWVGMTDEEISTVANNNHPLDGIRSFARAIEAKLKEKNT